MAPLRSAAWKPPFESCGSAQIAGPCDYVTERVAVFHSRGESGIEEIGGVGVRRATHWRAEICERFGKPGKFFAIDFDGVGVGGVPLRFEGGQIEQQQAKREQFPFGVLADKTHSDLADGCGGGVRGVAEFHRQEDDIVAKLGAADLHFSGDGGSLATEDGTTGGVRGGRGLAGLVEEDEAFHQSDASQGGHAGESLLISCGEKTSEIGLALRAGCGQDVAEGDSWSGCGGWNGGYVRYWGAGLGAGLLSKA